MKLEILLPTVEQRFAQISKDKVAYHVQQVKESGKYQCLAKRIAWDLLHATFKSSEVCEWYDKYQCNDTHITTLIVKAMQNIFGNDICQN